MIGLLAQIETYLEVEVSKKRQFRHLDVNDLLLESHSNKKVNKYLANFSYICTDKIYLALSSNK